MDYYNAIIVGFSASGAPIGEMGVLEAQALADVFS
jgi:hypothetical protein